MHVFALIARVLVIVGALNWGLVGAFNFNLVDAIFGEGSVGSRVVYILVGVAAVIALIELFVPRRAVDSSVR